MAEEVLNMPEYVWNITLKIRKVTLEVRQHLQSDVLSELHETSKFLIWYYQYTVESEYALWQEYARVLNMPRTQKVLNMFEYALE